MKNYIDILRLHHYLKNLIIFLPLFFGLKFLNFDLFIQTFFVFIAFSSVASAVYIFNDYFDMSEDQKHPVKKNRPLAAGKISKNAAFIIMGVLFIGGMTLSAVINFYTLFLLLAYVALNIIYTLKLKHIPIVDVFIISIFFVIRLVAGGEAAQVNLSAWIIIMTFLLALFLALAKRRDDVLIYVSNGVKTRQVIDGYNIEFLNASMVIMASVVMVSYIMYTVSSDVIEKTGSDKLYFTAIFVLLGILRYMQLSFIENKGGSPAVILLKDRFIQFSILAWFITLGFLLY